MPCACHGKLLLAGEMPALPIPPRRAEVAARRFADRASVASGQISIRR